MLLRCYRDGVDPKLSGGWLSTGDVGELDRRRPARRARPARRPDHHRRRERLARARRAGCCAAVVGVADVAVAGRDDPSGASGSSPSSCRDVERAADARCAPLRGEGSARRPRRATRARARRRSPAHRARQGAATRRAPAASVASRPWHHASKEKSQSSPEARRASGSASRGASWPRAPSVVLGDINEATLEIGGRASSATRRPRLHADVMDEDDVAALCAHALEHHGRLDIGVNAAGLGAYSPCRRSGHRDVGHRHGGQPPRRDALDEARGPSDGRRRERRLDHQHRLAQRDPARGGHGPVLRHQGGRRHVHEAARRWSSARTASGSTRSALGSSTRPSPRS